MQHRGKSREKQARDRRWAALHQEVRRWMVKNDISQSEVARRLGVKPTTAQRWFGLDDIASPPDDRMDELEQMIKEPADG